MLTILRREEAEKIYQYGIKNGPKRVDKLEQAYSQFLRRTPSSAPVPSSSNTAAPSSRSRVDDSKPDGPIKVSPTATINPRYAMMLAPIPPDKRPEKRRFDLSLLFTEEGMEYCAAEARAKSLGLYGKQWGKPPGPFVGDAPVNTGNLNLLGRSEHTRPMGRKSLMASEPTMTMNTKEALADIYGMYNSPEKTTKLASIPMRRVDATPGSLLPLRTLDPKSNHENQDFKIPAPGNVSRAPHGRNIDRSSVAAFKPFMDENASTPAAPKVIHTLSHLLYHLTHSRSSSRLQILNPTHELLSSPRGTFSLPEIQVPHRTTQRTLTPRSRRLPSSKPPRTKCSCPSPPSSPPSSSSPSKSIVKT